MSINDVETAIVDEQIRPQESDRVRFQNSWWPAKCDPLRWRSPLGRASLTRPDF
ncbi:MULTISPECIES: hypothetical protein [Microcoleaceae]|uniref:hypothetical protein n=1 Tax=Microcoleaceae TaxID=1892252 RepID=UPI001D13F2C5|nr:hypothetical protein [Tychonema sp. LEGE 06208]